MRDDWAKALVAGEEKEARRKGLSDSKAHLHPLGLSSNATSSEDSSSSQSRLGPPVPIQCSVSTLYFPGVKLIRAVFNTQPSGCTQCLICHYTACSSVDCVCLFPAEIQELSPECLLSGCSLESKLAFIWIPCSFTSINSYNYNCKDLHAFKTFSYPCNLWHV